MNRKLYRSTTNKMLGGVCGGLGDYLGVDPILVRLFFVLLTVTDGIGFFIYIALWVLTPASPQASWGLSDLDFPDRAREMSEDVRNAVRQPHPQSGLVIGGALILLGLVSLINNLNLPWLDWIDFNIFWPAMLIVLGVAWILRGMRGK